MKEYKFRGKRVDNGKWVYGYLFKIWDKSYILWGTTNNVPNMIEVIPETVGQYTGLHDKNGKEIYEGDIVKIKNSLIELEGEVIFDTIDLAFEVYDKEDDCKEMLWYTNKEFEVIL